MLDMLWPHDLLAFYHDFLFMTLLRLAKSSTLPVAISLGLGIALLVASAVASATWAIKIAAECFAWIMLPPRSILRALIRIALVMPIMALWWFFCAEIAATAFDVVLRAHPSAGRIAQVLLLPLPTAAVLFFGTWMIDVFITGSIPSYVPSARSKFTTLAPAAEKASVGPLQRPRE